MKTIHKLFSQLKNVRIRTVYYFVYLPALITVLTVVLERTGILNTLPIPIETIDNSYIGLFLIFLLFIPTFLTSLITSFIAVQIKRSLRGILLYWLVPTGVAHILFLLFHISANLTYSLQNLTEVLTGYLFNFTVWSSTGVLLSGIIGISLSRYFLMIRKGILIRIPKSYKYYIKTVPLILMLGLSLTFLTGNFVNTEDILNKDHFDYYVHRGIPFTFSGVLREGYAVSYPIITLPMFSQTLYDGQTFYKIVHIPRFLQALTLYFFLSIFPASQIAAISNTKKYYVILLVLSFLLTVYIFFDWSRSIV